eukprot:5068827-Amphidinium_carterae.1
MPSDVDFSESESTVTLTGKASKNDQRAAGSRRTRKCTCRSCPFGTDACPYHVLKEVLADRLRLGLYESSLFPTVSGDIVLKEAIVT